MAENELLEAAETLLGIIDVRPEFLTLEGAHKAKEAREIIERHRPKPKRLEGWINLYAPDEEYMGFIYLTEEDAKTHCSDYTLRQVHIREVVPVEWKPWTSRTVQLLAISWEELAAAHNAEMERVTG